MSRAVAFAIFALLSVGLMNVPQAALADEPTAESVLKRIPKLSTDNDDLNSFCAKVRICLPTPGLGILADVAWVRDKGESVMIYNPSTNLPIAFCADGQMMMYDVIAGKMIVMESANPVVQLAAGEESMKFNIGFNTKDKKIDIDLESFFKHSGEPTLERHENKWLLTSTSQSGRSKLVATVSPDKAWPLHDVDLSATEENQVVVSVSSISVNTTGDVPLQTFPKDDRFPKDVKIDRFAKKDSESAFLAAEAIAKFMRVIYGHTALAAPELRDNPLGLFIDWKKAAEAEKTLGPAFRKIIGYKEPPLTANATDAK